MHKTYRPHSLPQRQRIASRAVSVTRPKNIPAETPAPQIESQTIQIGQYKAFRSDLVGQGFCSKVYKATHIQSNQEYALKVIDLTRIKSNAQKRFLKNELKALTKLKNAQHVIHLVETIKTPTHLAIVTELCQTSLAQMLKKNHGRRVPLDIQEALKYFEQIILGYLAMRAQGLVHRDIKSANILIGKDGEIRLCDLGFATEDCFLYEDKTINVGSPLYMAPEVIKGNEYSAKADIWALGLVLLEMLIGDFPWSSASFNQLRSTLLKVKFQDLLPRDLQTKWKVMLLHCLQFDPRRRCGTMQLIKYIKPDYEESALLPQLPRRSSQSTIMPTPNNLTHNQNRLKQTTTTVPTQSQEITHKRIQHRSSQNSRIRTIDVYNKIEEMTGGLKMKNNNISGTRGVIKTYSSKRLTAGHNIKNQQLVALKLGERESVSDQIKRQQLSILHLARLVFKTVELIDKTNNNIHCTYLKVPQKTINNLISSIFELFDEIRQTKSIHRSQDVINFQKSRQYEKIVKICEQYSKNFIEYFKVKKHTIQFQDFYEEPLSEQLKGCLDKAQSHFQLIFEEIEDSRLPQITDKQLCEFISLADYLSTLVQMFKLKSQNLSSFSKTNRIEDMLKKQGLNLTINQIRKIANKVQD